MLSIVERLESLSAHPLARCVEEYCREELGENREENTETEFRYIPGKGIEGTVDGEEWWIGSPRMAREKGVDENSLIGGGEQGAAESGIVEVGKGNELCARFYIQDRLRADAVAAVRALQKKGVEVVLLSGDRREAVAQVARECGIRKYIGEALPGDKQDFIEKERKEGKTVAMAGDGINDSQALAEANVSIAMGTGSDIAIETAQLTLVQGRLIDISRAYELSKKTIRIIRENLFWAFIYNVIGMPVASGVLYPLFGILLSPMIASATMAVSSVCVVSNSLRLKKVKI